MTSSGIRITGKCNVCSQGVNVASLFAWFALAALAFFVLVQTRVIDLGRVYGALGLTESTGEVVILLILSAIAVILAYRTA